jgi:ribosomal protein L30/L7E
MKLLTLSLSNRKQFDLRLKKINECIVKLVGRRHKVTLLVVGLGLVSLNIFIFCLLPKKGVIFIRKDRGLLISN